MTVTVLNVYALPTETFQVQTSFPCSESQDSELEQEDLIIFITENILVPLIDEIYREAE